MWGRTAIVTGASRGIGLAIATALHEAGANVVLTARTEEAARSAAASLGDRAVGYGAHVADAEAASACVTFTLTTFGSIDVLVNNAGTNPAHGPVIDQDFGRFAKTMEINLWAPIMWTGLVARAWMTEHGGSIINTASIGGLSYGPQLGVYNISKAALIHATKQLAFELGPAIRVNAIAPGVVRTKLAEALWRDHEADVARGTPLQRIGEPADVGAAVAFLSSDAASWITGEVMVIDGGQVLGRVDGDRPS
jgi:hypothetical protein